MCVLNCVSIAFWERDLDLAQNKRSIGTQWPQAKPAAKIALVVLVLAAALIWLFKRNAWRLGVCLGSSALLLFMLDYLPIKRDTRTALADLVLLTPLVLFVAEKLV